MGDSYVVLKVSGVFTICMCFIFFAYMLYFTLIDIGLILSARLLAMGFFSIFFIVMLDPQDRDGETRENEYGLPLS